MKSVPKTPFLYLSIAIGTKAKCSPLVNSVLNAYICVPNANICVQNVYISVQNAYLCVQNAYL